MRHTVRLFAGFAALCLLTTGPTASAEPQPRVDEWWFSAWGVQKAVWPLSRGAGITVAVLDSGVNASVPELSGAVLKGSDTTGEKSDGRKDFDVEKDGHGTAMAALIAAQGGGRSGFMGIAPEAKILPVHVTNKLGDVGFFQALADGIRFAVDHGAKVINMSQGETSATLPDHCDPGVEDAVAYAVRHDVVLVASAGNTGNTTNWPELPASCPGVLAVGAIDGMLRPWNGTQRQPYVAVAGPGYGIGWVGRSGNYHPNSWGTSAASALTAGAVALIRSRNPQMPASTVVQRLIATAHHTGSSGWSNQTGHGPIQISSAMNIERYPVSPNAPNPVYDAFRKWEAVQGKAYTHTTTQPGQSGSSHTKPHSWLLALALSVAGALIVAGLTVLRLWRRHSRGNTSSRSRARPPSNPTALRPR